MLNLSSDNIYIVVVNGVPGGGKDLFTQEFLQEVRRSCSAKNFSCCTHSSVDTVKAIAFSCFGWDGVKDDKSRRLLYELKQAAMHYNDMPFNNIVSRVTMDQKDLWIKTSDPDGIVFEVLHIREPEEIQKIVDKFQNVYTILIEKKWGKRNQCSDVNASDFEDNIKDYPYDFILINRNKGEFIQSAMYMATHILETEGLLKSTIEQDQNQNQDMGDQDATDATDATEFDQQNYIGLEETFGVAVNQ